MTTTIIKGYWIVNCFYFKLNNKVCTGLTAGSEIFLYSLYAYPHFCSRQSARKVVHRACCTSLAADHEAPLALCHRSHLPPPTQSRKKGDCEPSVRTMSIVMLWARQADPPHLLPSALSSCRPTQMHLSTRLLARRQSSSPKLSWTGSLLRPRRLSTT